MQFFITLSSFKKNAIIPVNYSYPLSAAIYKILHRADAAYATFLHEKGYGKGFKLFTFSQINCPFRMEGDRLRLLAHEMGLTISFHVPRSAETFIKGIFMMQEIVIADKKSKETFMVRSIEAQAEALNGTPEREMVHVDIAPLSPVVCGLKNDRGNYDFLSPADGRFCEMLIYNWREKIKACYDEAEAEKALLLMEIAGYKNPPKSRLITIKADTPQETKIRGWMNFGLQVTGEKRFVEILLNSGAGVYNSMGMGCVGMGKAIIYEE